MQALLGEAREGLSDGEEALSSGEASVINGGQLLNEARDLIQVHVVFPRCSAQSGNLDYTEHRGYCPCNYSPD